ncbi:PqiC family protein [Alteromonas gilva]|uniref:ABC-type transport auxiliary lipoprotein family protein n=1 Tax=Alteromonas gilva TaxID=2987522 RepID=A0ABT5L417_9ALTE|nr:ABC-type transport auxiliary lipoprotein family protein [Alteromonas gilva]MDC8831785.1 ABC-type transport auxiliary lipoprotein family protein [Alteromonas gilva]
MNKWMFSIVVLTLAACSSQPTNVNYYLLHQPASATMRESMDISALPAIYLRSLSTPDYLKQRNLSLQTSASELHFAPQHVWAEDFSNAFVMALRDTLANAHKIRLYSQSQWSNSNPKEYFLDIQLDDFIPTYDNNVVLTGTYRLEMSHLPPQIVQFSFKLPLDQDGFASSVAQMRELIDLLAHDVVSRVESTK